jgi:hypothetical protein
MRNVLRGGGLALLGFCAIFAGSLTVSHAAATATSCSHCVFETSFTTGEGWTTDVTQANGGCGGTGFGGKQANVSQATNDSAFATWGQSGCSKIDTAGNNPLGRGGRGLSMARAGVCGMTPGENCQGTSARYSWSGGRTEIWWRVYIEYEAGFKWQNLNPAWSKDLRFDNGVIVDYLSGGFWCVFGMWASSCASPVNTLSSLKWNNLWDPSAKGASIGGWHCFEGYFKDSDGIADLWIDGTQVLHVDNVPASNGAYNSFYTSNQASVANGVWDTRFDDIAVSLTQRIGCFGGSAPPPAPPTALRIIR